MEPEGSTSFLVRRQQPHPSVLPAPSKAPTPQLTYQPPNVLPVPSKTPTPQLAYQPPRALHAPSKAPSPQLTYQPPRALHAPSKVPSPQLTYQPRDLQQQQREDYYEEEKEEYYEEEKEDYYEEEDGEYYVEPFFSYPIVKPGEDLIDWFFEPFNPDKYQKAGTLPEQPPTQSSAPNPPPQSSAPKPPPTIVRTEKPGEATKPEEDMLDWFFQPFNPENYQSKTEPGTLQQRPAPEPSAPIPPPTIVRTTKSGARTDKSGARTDYNLETIEESKCEREVGNEENVLDELNILGGGGCWGTTIPESCYYTVSENDVEFDTQVDILDDGHYTTKKDGTLMSHIFDV